MNRVAIYFKLFFPLAMVALLSCRNEENEKKAPDIIKPPAEAAHDSSMKNDNNVNKENIPAHLPENLKKNEAEKSNAATIAKIKNADKKKDEKNSFGEDSASILKTKTGKVSKNASAAVSTPASNQSAIKTAITDPVNKPFVSKYGIIPRDVNENSLSVFFNTFPDKTTLIKVNFDGPADTEMNTVKTQIIKVLKKNGYVDVSDRSETIEPKRMPKDIHYELQHDGSVVFWVPIANQEQ